MHTFNIYSLFQEHAPYVICPDGKKLFVFLEKSIKNDTLIQIYQQNGRCLGAISNVSIDVNLATLTNKLLNAKVLKYLPQLTANETLNTNVLMSAHIIIENII